MSAREILAYAITHAPKGVKGGPYEAESGPPGEECDSLRDACRWPTTETDARECATMYLEDHLSWCGDARVIRIVREARPSPSEASAVEVLRELVAWSDNEDADTDDVIRIAAKARRVLAASGPDPMPVVRAAMRYLDHGLDARQRATCPGAGAPAKTASAAQDRWCESCECWSSTSDTTCPVHQTPTETAEQIRRERDALRLEIAQASLVLAGGLEAGNE